MSRASINGTEIYAPPLVASVSNPAAGANFSYTVPTGGPYTLEAASIQLACSGTVANRILRVRVRRSGNILGQFIASAAVTAGQTVVSTWNKGTVVNVLTVTGQSQVMPTLPTILAGDVIDSVVLNIDATDQLSAIVLVFNQV